MKSMFVAGALLSVGSVTAAGDEYYLVRDLSTKQCSIIESPPTTTELALIENGRVYFERSEAERALATVCGASTSLAASAVGKSTSLQVEGRQPKKPKSRAAAKKLPGATANTQHVGKQDPGFSFFTLFR
jgi:hypothetical protein